MKKLFTKLFILAASVAALTSCNSKNDYDNSDYEKEIARIDSTNKAQAPKLKDYAAANFENPKLDTASGIWFDVISEPADDTYSYVSGSGSLTSPAVKAKYVGKLMNGTTFDSSTDGSDFTITAGQGGLIAAWKFAFYPKSIKYNGQTYPVGGITANGLKKGSKIQFIAPSTLCYDNRSNDKIPANSPLFFEIEVMTIQ
ncbi:FKBP-type peptidyl-prolyl cis-trans isomerase [Sphingobacterium psychroaquaticum]|uniref:FKBP-type peptidyl-prolyl cis-trans isomerase n=1 Tax=Sphingobacterium psychroaquaticum TaxID=561061 RepID=UPI00106BBB21|nr:FKBP-type peptidyl-prolyl cis-trans isomerase [Sphingobacterium psychroaquaticum]QBQ42554.1 FKBP-type peptidyl-prolyl cis-trans isomerase [Sphingobacterium psychroaquaticum]